jgi:hypothetical protein
MTAPGVYVTTLHPGEVFADPTYQRALDPSRCKKMCTGWDRRLAGIIEVSDRGPDESPRYAVIDGQHRWAAAGLLADPPLLVANVHEGLNIGQEAVLFDRLNRLRKQPTAWDHWRARKAAGNHDVLAIEASVSSVGLTIAEYVRDGHAGVRGLVRRGRGHRDARRPGPGDHTTSHGREPGMRDIPNTRLTATLRVLWRAQCDEYGWEFATFEEYYYRCVREGFGLGTPATTNGRALAALLFDRALTYWPDFVSPADLPAVAVWGELLDTRVPFATPGVIEQAVDAVAASGVSPCGPANFLRAATRIMEAQRGA